jgi:hypothetical protein
MSQAKPIGVPALISQYQAMAEGDEMARELKVALDHVEVMPNIPQMGRFFSSMGTALQLQRTVKPPRKKRCTMPRRVCDSNSTRTDIDTRDSGNIKIEAFCFPAEHQ